MHSGFWGDDLLCHADLATAEATSRAQAVAETSHRATTALADFDRRATELVKGCLDSVPAHAAEALPVARRTLETRIEVEPTWFQRLTRDPPKPVIRRKEEYKSVSAHLVYSHYDSDRISDPPIATTRKVWVLTDGRVAAAVGQMRGAEPFGRPSSGLSMYEHQDRERALVALCDTCEVPIGWEPLRRRPSGRMQSADTSVAQVVAEAAGSALPFFYIPGGGGAGIHMGRPVTDEECSVTLAWFAKALNDYVERVGPAART